ncbi:hypothetical protein GLOIN_2v1487024 [Rhizophagus clarus]|uniref:BAH domain-containing protein n=1 Tax=Rhizophagus clarus TaxID=94130 RepID=A0A8H3LJP6_9GLOM|nr:hypothetical protein GLOIN_2v1487024 [Rhizophagus clarus]
MIMPFILNSFLETSSLKENESRSILRRIQESRINMAKNFTLDSYDELQKCLEEEMKILPKVFPELLISKTCISISTCWCMQGLMNVELDLLKRYTTLFAIRHLVDGGADQRLSQPCRGFATITGRNEEAISSPVDFITNIILKRSLPSASFIYGHWTKVSSYIFSNGWYELATYTMEESDGVFSKVHLHIGDVVTIHEEDSGECYAIIKGIFKYKGNEYYAFITIDWFDNINRIHNVLKCPLFRIQTSQDIRWRKSSRYQ